jgi:hypothetical protein
MKPIVSQRNPTLLTANGTLLTSPSYERKRAVWVNSEGHVIGGDRWNARLSNDDIDLVLALRSEGLTARVIAEKFEASIHTIRSILQGRRRGQLGVDQRFIVPRERRFSPARTSDFHCPRI